MRFSNFVAWVFFVLMVLFYGFGLGGCARVFPGDSPVRVEGVGDWTRDAVDVEALSGAMALWNAVGARFSLDGGGPVLRVAVGDGLPWYVKPYVPGEAIGAYWEEQGEIFVDGSKVSAPHGLLFQAFAHELGHAIGLDHDAHGIMQPNLTQSYSLSPEDVDEYLAKWGRR